MTIDDWLDEVFAGAAAEMCNAPRSELPEISIDGMAGCIRDEPADDIEATIVVGRRLYVFTLFGASRPVFDAIAATIDLEAPARQRLLVSRSPLGRLRELDALLSPAVEPIELRAAVHARAKGNGHGPHGED